MTPIDDQDKNTSEEAEDDQNSSVEQKKLLHDKRMQRELYSEGRYHLIPGFFRTLMYLKKLKVEFALTFRTFG